MTDPAAPAAKQALPYGLNIRLTVDQRYFLQCVAEAHDLKLSAALRLVLDEAICQAIEDSRTPEGHRQDAFGIVGTWTPDPAWEARHGGDES